MELTINNTTCEVPTDYADELLLWFLRDGLGLTGTHYGCGAGRCGSCMVLVDGAPIRSCQTMVSSVLGDEVVTIEGLEKAADLGPAIDLHPVQQAFAEFPLQCMWCLPGHVMTAVALLEKEPDPSAATIAEAIEENLCRCGGYKQIEQAIGRAVEISVERRAQGSPRSGLPVGKGLTDGTRSAAELGPVSVQGGL